ncbi:hypothetical protein DIPPA_64275 [Diplonema papillatum]|nr:hypothetical protein DIPPA_64275 [Diplonema papillatum]
MNLNEEMSKVLRSAEAVETNSDDTTQTEADVGIVVRSRPKETLTLREMLQDEDEMRTLRVYAFVTIALAVTQGAVLVVVIIEVRHRLDQYLVGDPVETFRPLAVLLCATTSFVIVGMMLCHTMVGSKLTLNFFLKVILTRLVVVAVVLVVSCVPFYFVAKQFDCSCVQGSTFSRWMVFWGVGAKIVPAILAFLITCAAPASGTLGLGTGETSSSNMKNLALIHFFAGTYYDPAVIPMVNVLIAIGEVVEGSSLLVSRGDISDHVDNETNSKWVEDLTSIFIGFSVGTVLRLMSLIALGCPSAVQRSAGFRSMCIKAMWNTYVPGCKVLLRMFSLLTVIQVARWHDKSWYYPDEHVTSAEVVVSPFLIAATVFTVPVVVLILMVFPTCGLTATQQDEPPDETSEGEPSIPSAGASTGRRRPIHRLNRTVALSTSSTAAHDTL